MAGGYQLPAVGGEGEGGDGGGVGEHGVGALAFRMLVCALLGKARREGEGKGR